MLLDQAIDPSSAFRGFRRSIRLKPSILKFARRVKAEGHCAKKVTRLCAAPPRSPVFDAKPGEWYLCVICSNCETLILVFPDLNSGTSQLAGGYNNVTCYHCDHEGNYASEQVIRYQHPEKGNRMIG